MRPPHKRQYTSPARAQAAVETRRAIAAAATELFLEHGFARTTTKAVAKRAGVSERMIFLNYESKAALLSACIRAAVRDANDAVPMLERAEWRAVLAAPDPQQAYHRLAHAVRALYERVAPLLAIGEAAARDDPLLEEQRQRGHAATHADLLEIARALKRAGAVKRGTSAERAADLMFAIAASEDVYLRLVNECGWTAAGYEDALSKALIGALAP
jgi:AcrR family transcriptional regulator